MLSRNGRSKGIAGAGVLALVAVTFTPGPAKAATGTTTLVSVAADGTQATRDSEKPAISANGRYVAFTSLATNLVPGDNNGFYDIFVKDRKTGAVSLASVASDGTQANAHSIDGPEISADGRYVVFHSSARNLVAGGDASDLTDVFVHDRVTATTTKVSVDSNGIPAAGISPVGHSREPTISADGRYVAFHSSAANLVVGDTNGLDDVFVHDRQTATTTRVSMSSPPLQQQGAGSSTLATISPDGNFVVFQSTASNLVANDANNEPDVFLHNRTTGATTLVSVASDETQGNGPSGNSGTLLGFNDLSRPVVNAGGRYVVFDSRASNLVAGDTNNRLDLFVRDLQAGTTIRINVRSDGTQGQLGGAPQAQPSDPDITPDGRYVAFTSLYPLVPEDTNENDDVFVRDLEAGATTRLSIANNGTTQGSQDSYSPALSSDATKVAFSSAASNLVPDTNGAKDVFLRDTLGTPVIPTTIAVGDAAVYEGHEGTRGAVFTVSLSKPSSTTVTVAYTTRPGSNTGPGAQEDDYIPKSGVLSFAPGVTSLPVKVPVLGDVLTENTQGFNLVLSDSTGAPISVSEGSGGIINDDPPLTGRFMTIGDVAVHEGDAGGRVATFTVSLSGPSTTTIAVNYATAKGTAVGTDFTAKSGTLSFAPGTTSLQVKVAINPDTLVEGNETFNVKLSGLSGTGTLLSDATGVGTIIDND